jgi:hypothetical protein
MIEKFRNMPHVTAVTPMYQPSSLQGKIMGGNHERYTIDGGQIVGMYPDAIEQMGYSLVTGNYNISAATGKRIPVLIGEQVPFSFRDTKKNANSPNAMKYPQYDEEYINITNLPQYDKTGTLLNPEEFFFDVMNFKLIYKMEIGYDEDTKTTKYKEYELVPVGMISGGKGGDYMVSNGIVMSIESAKKLEADYKRANKSAAGTGGGRSVDGAGEKDGTTTVVGYETVYVKVKDVDHMADVEKAIKAEGYQIYSMSETRDQMQGQVAQTQMMLGGLAAISLFVAALNIMNTMTMAITERTREIGVMKVLGCRLSDIRRMFLIEAGAIGLIGGLIGCILSILLSLLLNNLPAFLTMLGINSNLDIAASFGLSGLTEMMPGTKLSVIPLWLIAFGLLFATAVGLLSGVSPAKRAVKISSLEAIRHD